MSNDSAGTESLPAHHLNFDSQEAGYRGHINISLSLVSSQI